jgi:hypothetical protein
MNKALPSFYCKNQVNVELGIGISHQTWKIKDIAPPELIPFWIFSIDILPLWGKIELKVRRFSETSDILESIIQFWNKISGRTGHILLPNFFRWPKKRRRSLWFEAG